LEKYTSIYIFFFEEFINTLNLLTAKPVVFLLNMNIEAYIKKKGKYLAQIKQWVDSHCPGEVIIPFSAEFEKEVADLPATERPAYLASKGPNVTSALSKIILTGYSALNLIHFFTAGEVIILIFFFLLQWVFIFLWN
jgi:obg-like ATPase 1